MQDRTHGSRTGVEVDLDSRTRRTEVQNIGRTGFTGKVKDWIRIGSTGFWDDRAGIQER